MELTPIASGSSGNCYLLRGDTYSVAGNVMIELGIPWNKILSAINFHASRLDFACCTHMHKDHSLAVKNALNYGVNVGMSQETAEALGVQEHHRIVFLKAGEQKKIGRWTILPFTCVHDVPTLGFVIANDSDRLLFVPDTAYIKNRFNGITIAAIECNFAEDILSRNILNGYLAPVVGHRIRRSHMSLQTVIELLKANDLSRCRQIFLLHLSSGNSDEAQMIKEVQKATGIPCFACS